MIQNRTKFVNIIIQKLFPRIPIIIFFCYSLFKVGILKKCTAFEMWSVACLISDKKINSTDKAAISNTTDTKN